MKTRHILTAIALPALLAACTQDELVEVTGQQDYNDVPTVDVTFTATKSGVDTKMFSEFGWQLGDKVGLGWLDQNTDGKVIFDNPLYCTNEEGGSFKAETMLRVGKYIAYMPYAGLTNTAYIPFSIAKQPLVTADNRGELAKYAIFISPAITELDDANELGQVDPGKQEAGLGKNVQLSLPQLTNAVALNLNFTNTEKLTDLEVLGVKVDVRRSGTYTNSLMVGAFTYDASKTVSVKTWDDEAMNGAAFFYESNKVANSSEVEGIQLANEDGSGIAVSNNTVKVYAYTLPLAATTADEVMYVTVETNYGTVTVASTKDDKSPITIANAKTWIESPIFTKFNQSASINVAIDGKNIAVTNAAVSTQAELGAALKTLVASGQTSKATITLSPAALQPSAFTLEDFTTPEGLAAEVELVAGQTCNGITLKGENTIASPFTIHPAITLDGTLTVKYCEDKDENALTTLNMANLTINAGAKLVNEGVMQGTTTINAADEEEELPAGLYVSAAETAVYEQGGVALNNGEIQWIAGKRPSVTAGNGIIFAEVKDFATLLAADKHNVKIVRFVEDTTFDNEKDELDNMTNITTIECYADVIMNVNAANFSGAKTIVFTNVGNVVVEEGASLSILSDDEDNAMTLKTDAVITVNKSATLTVEDITFTNEVTVNNSGAVVVNGNVNHLAKGTLAEGSTWNENK